MQQLLCVAPALTALLHGTCPGPKLHTGLASCVGRGALLGIGLDFPAVDRQAIRAAFHGARVSAVDGVVLEHVGHVLAVPRRGRSGRPPRCLAGTALPGAPAARSCSRTCGKERSTAFRTGMGGVTPPLLHPACKGGACTGCLWGQSTQARRACTARDSSACQVVPCIAGQPPTDDPRAAPAEPCTPSRTVVSARNGSLTASRSPAPPCELRPDRCASLPKQANARAGGAGRESSAPLMPTRIFSESSCPASAGGSTSATAARVTSRPLLAAGAAHLPAGRRAAALPRTAGPHPRQGNAAARGAATPLRSRAYPPATRLSASHQRALSSVGGTAGRGGPRGPGRGVAGVAVALALPAGRGQGARRSSRAMAGGLPGGGGPRGPGGRRGGSGGGRGRGRGRGPGNGGVAVAVVLVRTLCCCPGGRGALRGGPGVPLLPGPAGGLASTGPPLEREREKYNTYPAPRRSVAAGAGGSASSWPPEHWQYRAAA